MLHGIKTLLLGVGGFTVASVIPISETSINWSDSFSTCD